MEMTHEVRHLEGIKGNFYISETEYLAPAGFTKKESLRPKLSIAM